MAELFATTGDAYLILGLAREATGDTHTPDGRPATRTGAVERLARMVCADLEGFGEDDARSAAAHVFTRQKETIRASVDRVLSRMGSSPETIVISGSGEFLSRAVAGDIGCEIVSLAAELGAEASTAASAYALRQIANDTIE